MKYVVYCFLCVELCGAGLWYVYSPDGYGAYRCARDAYDNLQIEIQTVRKQIAQYDAAYEAWEHDPFWYEQYARTQLHMGYPDETVYILS